MAIVYPTSVLAGVRQRASAALSTELADLGWTESRYTFDQFGLDPRDTAHLSYAVGLLDSRPHPGSRQRPQNIPTITRFAIRYGYRIRPDNAVVDYDSSLLAEWRILDAMSKAPTSVTAGFSPRWVSSDRVIRADGTLYVGTIVFECLHNYAWSAPD